MHYDGRQATASMYDRPFSMSDDTQQMHLSQQSSSAGASRKHQAFLRLPMNIGGATSSSTCMLLYLNSIVSSRGTFSAAQET